MHFEIVFVAGKVSGKSHEKSAKGPLQRLDDVVGDFEEPGFWKIRKVPSNNAKCMKCKINIEAGSCRPPTGETQSELSLGSVWKPKL